MPPVSAPSAAELPPNEPARRPTVEVQPLSSIGERLVYVRLHGPDDAALYAGSYGSDDLHWWAQRLQEWHEQGRDVLAYFNNDGGGNAVRNARTLRALLRDAGVTQDPTQHPA